MNVIEVKSVSVSYKTGYNKSDLAIKDVSFNVPEGDFLCIVGDNGSGKSSLVKAIAGINNVTTGEIIINVNRDEISFLAQSTDIPIDFPATVNEVVISGTQSGQKFSPFYNKKNYEEAFAAMKLLGIVNLENKRFGELSGGQRQRVLLARAICRNPKLMILDEPFAALDVSTVDSLYKFLKDLNRKMNTTIIMVTHNQNDVINYALHVVELNKTVLFYGTKSQWVSRRKRGE